MLTCFCHPSLPAPSMCLLPRLSQLLFIASVRIIPKTFLQTTNFRHTFLIVYRTKCLHLNFWTELQSQKCLIPLFIHTNVYPAPTVLSGTTRNKWKRHVVFINWVEIKGNVRRLEKVCKDRQLGKRGIDNQYWQPSRSRRQLIFSIPKAVQFEDSH